MALGSNGNDPMNARRQGVRKATQSQSASRKGEPRKVLGVSEAKVMFVTYTDAVGVAQTGLFFEVNGELLSTSDTTQWCKGLHPIADWLRPLVEAALNKQQPANIADVPVSDSVDVT